MLIGDSTDTSLTIRRRSSRLVWLQFNRDRTWGFFL